MKAILLACALMLVLSGCQTVKVGDMKYSYAEVCSKEYDKIKYGISGIVLGCMPPQRFVQVEEFHFAEIRPLLKEEEVNAINLKAAEPEGAIRLFSTIERPNGREVNKNIAPSYIGRLFALEQDDKVPASGNMTYPLLDIDKINQIPTKVLISTELDGSSVLKSKVAVALDIEKIVNSIVAAYPLESPEKAILKQTLEGVALEYSRSKEIDTTSFGKYQYATIEEDSLDQLIQVLSDRCIIKHTGKENGVEKAQSCKLKADDSNNISSDITILADELENRIKHNNFNNLIATSKTYGLIIGAALINTSGATSNCTTTQLGGGNVTLEYGSISTCQQLKDKLKGSVTSKVETLQQKANIPAAKSLSNQMITEDGLLTQKTAVTEQQIKDKEVREVIDDASAKLAQAFFTAQNVVLKNLKLNGHSSILAIHYIVLREYTPPPSPN